MQAKRTPFIPNIFTEICEPNLQIFMEDEQMIFQMETEILKLSKEISKKIQYCVNFGQSNCHMTFGRFFEEYIPDINVRNQYEIQDKLKMQKISIEEAEKKFILPFSCHFFDKRDNYFCHSAILVGKIGKDLLYFEKEGNGLSFKYRFFIFSTIFESNEKYFDIKFANPKQHKPKSKE